MPIFCTGTLFVIWYAIMFNHIRFAMPAYLMFFATAFIGATVVAQAAWSVATAVFAEVAWYASERHGLILSAAPPTAWVVRAPVLSRLWSPRLAVNAATIALALLLVIRPAPGAGLERLHALIPVWIGRDLVGILSGRTSVDDYLATRQEGYAVYRYIAEHGLSTVFQPLDSGSTSNAAAYNGGVDGHSAPALSHDARRHRSFRRIHS